MKKITALLLAATASVALAGCKTTFQEDQSRRSKITQFALNHPVAAAAIGSNDRQAANLTSNASRFARNSGLDDTANGDGRGTQANAFDHTLWQAAITAQFGSKLAAKAAEAYALDSELREGKTDYFSRLAADQAVNVRNSQIGREIGQSKAGADMKSLAADVLLYYRQTGLWTATTVKDKGRSIWRISQNTLSEKAFNKAAAKIGALNQDGMTTEEERFKTNILRDIKQSISDLQELAD